MTDWTPMQKKAIENPVCDLLVSAAAGSGKTAVLSERVIRRITEGETPIPVEKLLIVTFTNAAAAEMRSRIVEKLRAKIKEDPQNKTAKRQLLMAPKANIMTIHAFCLNLIKNNFHLLDIDPSFTTIDEADKNLLKIQVVSDVMDEMYENFGKAYSDTVKWLSGGDNEKFGETIIKVYNFISAFEDPIGWLTEQTEKYNVSPDTAIDDIPWITELKRNYREILGQALEMYDTIIEAARTAGHIGYEETFTDDKSKIANLYSLLSGDWKDFESAAVNMQFNNLSTKGRTKADINVSKSASAIRESIKDCIKTKILSVVQSTANSDVAQTLRLIYPFLQLMLESVSRFYEKFAFEKHERNVIDFNDYEHIALKLLQDESLGVAAELRSKFDEIYVDEYQDCNSVQEAIFSAISRKTESGESCNMFMVGDVKQSIYRFRNADPDIFVGKQNTYGESGARQKITLNNNFRSRPEVIDCVNALFKKIMNKDYGGIDYNEDEKLKAGFPYPESAPECDNSPELALIVNEENDDISNEKLGAQPEYVALKILEMVGRFKVYDAKTKQYRPSTFRDFAVLLQYPNRKGDKIADVFRHYKIPYFCDVDKGLLNAHETILLLNMLKITDNALQDIPLIGFMRSKIGGFDENELLEIRSVKKKAYFYNAVKECAKQDTPLGRKCEKLIEMISGWRSFSKCAPLSHLIARIKKDTCFDAYIRSVPGGKLRTANVELFLENVKKFENSNGRGLFSFIKYIEENEKKNGDKSEAKPLSDSADVVRIMSIHKSKGLEFPVVFLVHTSNVFNFDSAEKEKIYLHKKYGIGCKGYDPERHLKYPVISESIVKNAIKNDLLSENMRLLYVAMTRAREKLICTALLNEKNIEKISSVDYIGKTNPFEIASARSFIQWIKLSVENCGWKVTALSPNEILEKLSCCEDTSARELENTEVSEEVEKEIDRRISYEYPYGKSSALSAKYSVSEVKRKFDDSAEEGNRSFFKVSPVKPKFMQSDRISSTELGTVYHLLLKVFDFAAENPEAELLKKKKYLIDNAFITEKEAEKVNDEIILGFVKSEIAKKIVTADKLYKLYKEIPFNICVSGDIPSGDKSLSGETVLLQGIIDCLFTDENYCYVLDYKTESRSHTEDELMEAYKKQLELYEIAAEKITGKPVKESYLYLLNRGVLKKK